MSNSRGVSSAIAMFEERAKHEQEEAERLRLKRYAPLSSTSSSATAFPRFSRSLSAMELPHVTPALQQPAPQAKTAPPPPAIRMPPKAPQRLHAPPKPKNMPNNVAKPPTRMPPKQPSKPTRMPPKVPPVRMRPPSMAQSASSPALQQNGRPVPPPQVRRVQAPPGVNRSVPSTPFLGRSLDVSAESLGLEAILGRQKSSSLNVPATPQHGSLPGMDLAGTTPKLKLRKDRPVSMRKGFGPLKVFGARKGTAGALDDYMAGLLDSDSGAASENESETDDGDVVIDGWENGDEEKSWPSDWTLVKPPDINLITGEVWGMLECAQMDSRGFQVEWGRANVAYGTYKPSSQPGVDTQEPYYVEYTSRDVKHYNDNLRQANHELAITGGESGDNHAVLMFDCPSKNRTIRLMVITKTGTYRTVVRGVTSKKDLFKKVGTGEICPQCGLKGAKQFVPVKMKDAKSDANGSSDFAEAINKLESAELIKTFKWGVLNVKAGQTDEDEMYSNIHEESSADYLEFLEFLGEQVELSGWTKYRGGLDNRGTNATGTHSVYTEHRGFEIMFHVATLLPFQKDDAQRVERKRHLGNDITCLIFRETDAPPFDPCVLTTQFTNVFCVVNVAFRDETTNEPFYQVVIANKTGMPPYGPYLNDPPVYARSDPAFRDMLLTKLINGERCALWRAPDFKFKMQRTRKAMLAEMAEPFLK